MKFRLKNGIYAMNSTTIIRNRLIRASDILMITLYSCPSMSICSNNSARSANPPPIKPTIHGHVFFVVKIPDKFFNKTVLSFREIQSRFSTEASAMKTFMPCFRQSISKPVTFATLGEKQASTPTKSLGIKYPPSPLGPNLINSNWVKRGVTA